MWLCKHGKSALLHKYWYLEALWEPCVFQTGPSVSTRRFANEREKSWDWGQKCSHGNSAMGFLTNRMWFTMVCTLIDNDTSHHSGQNFVALWVHNKFWPLWWHESFSIRIHTTLNHIKICLLSQYQRKRKNERNLCQDFTNSDLKVHTLHYYIIQNYELLVHVRLSFQKLCKLAQHVETIREKYLRKE